MGTARWGRAGSPSFSDTNARSVGGTPSTSSADTNSQTTGGLAYNASASDIQAALEKLAGIGTGRVGVAAASGGFHVTFTGDLGHQAVPLLPADAGELVNVSLLSYHQDTRELDLNLAICTILSIPKPS